MRRIITLLLILAAFSLTALPGYGETAAPGIGGGISIRSRLVDTALSYVGTYYKYAGTSRSGGFDCSGLVYRTYVDAAGIRLPRMVPDMYNTGTPIAKSELLPGDLLFFNTLGYVSHVGMYIGDAMFVHAENEKTGVIVTPLTKPYYVRTYVGARRHLKAGPPEIAAAEDTGSNTEAAGQTAADPFSYFHGYFDSSFGPMTLLVTDTYGNARGQYKTSSGGTGELYGKIDLGKMAFVGKWSISDDRGSAGGDVYFYLNEEKAGLKGYWRYSGERKWMDNWHAVKR